MGGIQERNTQRMGRERLEISKFFFFLSYFECYIKNVARVSRRVVLTSKKKRKKRKEIQLERQDFHYF